MNILIRELKANRKALIIWSISMFLLVVSGMSKYSAYSSSQATGDVFARMPDTLKALLGMGTLNVTTMSGFYAFLFSYLVLTAAIHAVLLGNSVIAKEERDKTTEFIITKPVSRTSIVTGKLLAALINIIIFNIVSLFSSILMVNAYNKGKSVTGELLAFDLSLLLVQLIFLSLGAFLAAFVIKPKSSGSIATGILLAGYVISKVTDLNDHLNALNVLSPFKYFNYADIAEGKGLNAVTFFLCLLLTGLLTAGAYYFYRRRDLNI